MFSIRGDRLIALVPLPILRRNLRNMERENIVVLVRMFCSSLLAPKDSNLGKVGHENGLRVIRLCKEDINLEDPNSIEQLIAQVDALKGCSIHGSIECKPRSQWQTL